jgi:hypothetical protein
MTDFQNVLGGRAAEDEDDDGGAPQVNVGNGERRASLVLTFSLRNTLVLRLAGSRNGATIAK